MSKKKNTGGIVFSTDPNFVTDEPESEISTLPASQQKLRLRYETKHRGGKAVTIVTGFIGTEADLEWLGKQLKNHCGTGGTVKEAEILIQGDHRPKVLAWLQKNGYTNSR